MKKVAISIVSFNTRKILEDCLKSILNQKSKNRVEIWVVDNNSHDGSAQMVEKEFPSVKLIKNAQNSGFAKGHNIAFKKIKADYVLILNSDTLLGEGVIDQMVDFMDNNSKCGIASCKIYDFEGNLQPNGGDLPFGVALFSWLFNLEFLGNMPNFHRNEPDYYLGEKEVGWVSGSFMMIREAVLQKVGFLNEDYFMYFEDAEFCYKAKQKGFKVMINPKVSIKHIGGASSKEPRLRQWSGEMRGLINFYSKQFGFLAGGLIRLLVYVTTVLRMAAFAITGRFNTTKTYGKILLKI